MEKLFQEHVNALAEKGFIGKETARIASEADMAADELQLPEIEAYAKREVNVLGNFKVLKEHGLLGLHVPKRYSGLGGDAFALSLVFERLGQVSMGLVTSYDVQTCLTAAPLEEWGTEEQKREYLTPLAKGDKMMSFCLTEPLEGSDPGSLQTKFEENRDGFKISGEKYLITNGSYANAFIVFCRNAKRGISAIIVERDEKRTYVEAEIKEKPGLFTSDTTLLKFDEAFAPKENLLGSFGSGLKVAYTGLLTGRLGIAAGAVGAIEDCLNASVARARDRVQFGKAIGKHQLVQRRISTIEQQLVSATGAVDDAAHWKRKYDADTADKAMRKAADHKVTIAKVIATNAAGVAADNAIQLHGGSGYSILSSAGRQYADLRASRIYEGSNDVLELKLASDLLGEGFEAYR